MLLETIAASLIPIVAEGLKNGLGRVFTSGKPPTVEERLKLDSAEIDKIKALAELDNPAGTPSQWVVDLRASSRYIAAWACIALGGYMLSVPTLQTNGSELIGVAFGFLFGTRIVASWKK